MRRCVYRDMCDRIYMGVEEKMNDIQENDIVNINFNNAQYTLCSKAKVLHVPCATGDSWQFEDIETKKIHYVSEGCTITKEVIK